MEDMVSHILNTRYNERLTTIITTNYRNLPPGGRPENERPANYRAAALTAKRRSVIALVKRMRSRLHEMCRIVEMEGR